MLAYFRRQNGRAFFPPLPIAALAPAVGVGHTYTLRLGMLGHDLNIFAAQNASVVSNPRWHFSASHEARRRMAVYARQHTGNRTRPASRGTCRATAVTPKPTLMSHERPARIARSPGCRGSSPAASREACCRAAVIQRPSRMSHWHPARPWRAVRKRLSLRAMRPVAEWRSISAN